ncbi:trigger factor-like protein TIG, Chloroplastic [Selaginella moellendorffii]|nr:trigger factor-like protein TIG, Chloroplastic [Selaginella moellendorffii]|eukprot:XP_002981727.2 trigger factor-like protein TIG, Chloroplastic [Selaginella moellendorffii]
MHPMPAAIVSPLRVYAHNPEAPVCSSSSVVAAVVSYGKITHNAGLLRFGIRCKRRRGVLVAMASAAAAEPSSPEVITTPKGLQVQETQNDGNARVRLKVRVPGNLCKEIYDETLLDFSKKVKVKGFRPGKVPEWVLLSQIGQKRVESEAVKLILEKTLPEAMASVAGRALKDSEEIVTKFDSLLAAFTPTSPLSYHVAVDVIPDVEWTSKDAYKHMVLEVEGRDDIGVQNAADAELASRHKDLGSLRVVTGRGLEMNDVVIIDISAARINSDGTIGDKILSCTQKGFSLDTEESTSYIPGLVQNMMDQKGGETRTFDLVFPPDWNQEHLRNIKARFTVECKEVFLRVVPDLNDEIAEKLVEGCKTLEQVKQALLKKHQLIEENNRKNAARGAVLEKLSKIAKIQVPKSLLEEQGRQIYAAKLMELHIKQRFDKKQMEPLTSEEMVNNFIRVKHDEISATVRQSIAVAEVFRLEKLQYTRDELEAEVKSAIDEFKIYNQEYDEKKVREQAQEMLEGAKVLDWLLEQADIRYVTTK